MPRKEFPQIASMPSFRVHHEARSADTPLRSIETRDLQSLPPTSSPYSKRSVEFAPQAALWTPISISSASSDDDEDEPQHPTVVENKGKLVKSLISDNQSDNSSSLLASDLHALPVVIEKKPSMLCLRSRRDQQFQGARLPKQARIVNKGGDRNIESINLPEKSARFLKDIVHTLVRSFRKLFIGFSAIKFSRKRRLRRNGVGSSASLSCRTSSRGLPSPCCSM
jgi:hypothetical protein